MDPISPISPISAISGAEVVGKASIRPASLDAMADRFSRLMEAQPPQPVQHDPVGSQTTVSHFLGTQEQLMRSTFDSVRDFSVKAPSMTPAELASQQIALSYQLATVQLQFNAGAYLAQSGKNGLQTLMKNQ